VGHWRADANAGIETLEECIFELLLSGQTDSPVFRFGQSRNLERIEGPLRSSASCLFFRRQIRKEDHADCSMHPLITARHHEMWTNFEERHAEIGPREQLEIHSSGLYPGIRVARLMSTRKARRSPGERSSESMRCFDLDGVRFRLIGAAPRQRAASSNAVTSATSRRSSEVSRKWPKQPSPISDLGLAVQERIQCRRQGMGCEGTHIGHE